MLFGDDCAGSLARASERAGWAEEITRAWAQGGANTLALARIVRSARRGLERGDWSRLWESRQLPFSRRKAQMLLVIAEGLDWVNAQTFAQMPHGWSILYLLAQLQRTQLEHLIADGFVHSRLKLSEAKELVNRFRPGNRQSAVRGLNLPRRFEKFEEFIADTVEDWSPEQREWASRKLEAIALLVEINPDSSAILPLPLRRGEGSVLPPTFNFGTTSR